MNSARNSRWLPIFVLLVLCGCGRDLMFTTYTTLGVEVRGVNNMPTSLRLAYKRFEGAVVPVEVIADVDPKNQPVREHSILGTMEVRQKLFYVSVAQVFATGEAAERAAGVATINDGQGRAAAGAEGFATTVKKLKETVENAEGK